ncbi:uncharacterized protein LOC142471230 isoform X1 [Ascaphus truei]|uniref:uncharacterized protein LOC142471230 isoform X1 n=1 Tax=Ascaphus truei TaxID=8439 RepID=UPI003F59474E
MTSSLSQYVDYFLHPYVAKLRSHVRDTLHVIDSISEIRWKPTYLWATCDVTSLYTCIEHARGLEAIKYWLDRDPSFPDKHKQFIIECIHFILTHNYFLFEDKFHLQICGTAMGTRFAPSYANLFMGHWEESSFWQNTLLGAGLVYYGRFIDYIIMIWDGEASVLSGILSSFDDNLLGLKFTFEISKLSTVFLDLALSTDTDLNIITTTHFKSVSVNSYVHASSNHHKQWLNNIPLGQFHRIRRNCTRDVDFKSQSVSLGNKFLSKGYDPALISDSFDKVSSSDRSTLLNQSKNKQHKGLRLGYDTPVVHSGIEASTLRFITNYNQSFKAINKILNDHWSVLKCDPHLGPTLQDRATVTYRKARSIKSILAPTRLRSSSTSTTDKLQQGPLGNHPCGRSRCITCRHLLSQTQVCSSIRGTTHAIKSSINCLSTYVVYLIQCGCDLKYVGRTTRTLGTRFLEHRRNAIKGLNNHSLSRHFKTFHQQDPKTMKVMGIETISPNTLGGDRFIMHCTALHIMVVAHLYIYIFFANKYNIILAYIFTLTHLSIST